MARFCGIVGYIGTREEKPGVWKSFETERVYRGDVIRQNSRWETGQGVNDDLSVSSNISILADAFAYENFAYIKYVEFMGAKWKVITATPERPRITLTLGGIYNG